MVLVSDIREPPPSWCATPPQKCAHGPKCVHRCAQYAQCAQGNPAMSGTFHSPVSSKAYQCARKTTYLRKIGITHFRRSRQSTRRTVLASSLSMDGRHGSRIGMRKTKGKATGLQAQLFIYDVPPLYFLVLVQDVLYLLVFHKNTSKEQDRPNVLY